MRSLRYLNTILTVLAVLLALQLWTAWMGNGGLAAPARAVASPTGGIPDAGAQRKEMIDLLKALNEQSSDLVKVLKSGDVRVKLENAPAEGAR
jgi:hypothetical protein